METVPPMESSLILPASVWIQAVYRPAMVVAAASIVVALSPNNQFQIARRKEI
jgi:hypothetical protein